MLHTLHRQCLYIFYTSLHIFTLFDIIWLHSSEFVTIRAITESRSASPSGSRQKICSTQELVLNLEIDSSYTIMSFMSLPRFSMWDKPRQLCHDSQHILSISAYVGASLAISCGLQLGGQASWIHPGSKDGGFPVPKISAIWRGEIWRNPSIIRAPLLSLSNQFQVKEKNTYQENRGPAKL